MIAAERHPLYNRVALPRYLRGQVRREKVFMRTVEDYAKHNLEIHFETWATEVDVTNKVVRTNRGQEFGYDALLIATGGRPKPPPWHGSDEVSKCIGFQTLDDTDAIIEKADASERELDKGIVTDAKLRTSAPDVYAAGDIAVFFDLMVERHNQMGTWDNAEAHGKVAAHNMTGADEDFFDVPTYTTTMFGSTLAVMGVTPDVQPDLESVRTYSFDEKFYRKLFFKGDRLVGAIMIGPPKGRKKLIEIMRSRQRIERPKQDLLDPNNLKD